MPCEKLCSASAKVNSVDNRRVAQFCANFVEIPKILPNILAWTSALSNSVLILLRFQRFFRTFLREQVHCPSAWQMSLEDRFLDVQQSFVSESQTHCIRWLGINHFQQVVWWTLVHWNSKNLHKLASVVCISQSLENDCWTNGPEPPKSKYNSVQCYPVKAVSCNFDWKVCKWTKFPRLLVTTLILSWMPRHDWRGDNQVGFCLTLSGKDHADVVILDVVCAIADLMAVLVSRGIRSPLKVIMGNN